MPRNALRPFTRILVDNIYLWFVTINTIITYSYEAFVAFIDNTQRCRRYLRNRKYTTTITTTTIRNLYKY